MLKNYVLTAFRNLLRNRVYLLMTLLGLTVGFASSLLILQYVRYELSFDSHIHDVERIGVFSTRFDVQGRDSIVMEGAPGPSKHVIAKGFPEIEAVTRVFSRRNNVKREGDVFRQRIQMVDPEFFDVFRLELIQGETKSVAESINSIVVSESTAEKYFGDENPIGKTLELDDNIRPRTVEVVGVFKDLPSNSTNKWELIYKFDEELYKDRKWMAELWTSINCYLFIKTKRAEDLIAINQALPEFEKSNVPNTTFNGVEYEIHEIVSMSVLSLSQHHLFGGGLTETPVYIWVATFSLIAVIILAIACFNFVNLSVARASERGREVALRKVLGARRRDLIVQFLCESVLLATIGMTLGLLLAELVLPSFASFVDRELSIHLLGNESILPWTLLLILLVGVLGGLYPAFYLAHFRPAEVLHANRSDEGTRGGWVRFILVTTQFAVSVVLLICTTVVYLQTMYAVEKDLGFNKDGIIVVRGFWHDALEPKTEVMRKEAASIPGVTSVAFSSEVPGDSSENNTLVRIPGTTQDVLLGRLMLGPDMLDTYQMRLLAGRKFSRDRSQDDATDFDEKDKTRISALINDLALPKLGYASPEDAIGKIVQLGKKYDESGSHGLQDVEIVGVVSSFNYKKVNEKIRPSIYIYTKNRRDNLSVRFSGIAGPVVMKALEGIWKEQVEGIPFRGEYLNENLAKLYEKERRVAGLFAFFSGLAVVIACLGLYGLAAITTHRRTKEIAVRKVLGANTKNVVSLVIWQFSRPALLANLIAWPIAYYGMRWWLDGFAYRIELEMIPFLGASLLTLILAWLTVGGQVWRVARIHPAVALRHVD